MKAWVTKALDFLKASLEPPRHELNELDWKAGLQIKLYGFAPIGFTSESTK